MASVGKLGYIHVADDGDGTEYETVEDWAAAVAKHSKGYLGESISIGSRTHRELELSRRRDALFEQSGAYQLFLTTQVPESDEDPVNALVGQVRGTWARCSGGPGQDPCPHSSHPDVGCHMPGNAPQCNEVHKAHPDHDPALPDCDTMAGSGDPWAASPPPSARTLGLSE